MSSCRQWQSALYLGFLLAACESSEPVFSAEDAEAVRAQVQDYVNTTLAGDHEAFGNIFTTDAIALPPNSPPVEGRQSIIDYASDYPPLTRFTVNIDEVTGVGDLAYSRGTYSLAAMLPDSSEVTEDGSFLNVHRRAEDGTWPYVRWMWHSDAPMQPAPQ